MERACIYLISVRFGNIALIEKYVKKEAEYLLEYITKTVEQDGGTFRIFKLLDCLLTS